MRENSGGASFAVQFPAGGANLVRPEPDLTPLSDEYANVIVLSDEFYREVTEHPIPTDLDALKVLSAAPAILDLFMWLVYRCFVAKNEERIPLFGEYGLAHQIGTADYSRPRRFRAMLEQWLKTIRALWPSCPARISSEGRDLLIRHALALQGAGEHQAR